MAGAIVAGENLPVVHAVASLRVQFDDGVPLDAGRDLRCLARNEEALHSYDRALAIKPGHAVELSNRGNALRDLNRRVAVTDGV